MSILVCFINATSHFYITFTARRPSVSSFLCDIRYAFHAGWNTSKIISLLMRLRFRADHNMGDLV